jgi:hypothetical protein
LIISQLEPKMTRTFGNPPWQTCGRIFYSKNVLWPFPKTQGSSGESWKDIGLDSIDIESAGARGYDYEKIDQLALEHLMGVHE